MKFMDNALLNALDQGIMLVDKEGKIVFANQSCLKKLNDERLIGRLLNTILWEPAEELAGILKPQKDRCLYIKTGIQTKLRVSIDVLRNESGDGQFWLVMKDCKQMEATYVALENLLDHIHHSLPNLLY